MSTDSDDTAAKRQARFRNAKRAKGFRQTTFWIHDADYKAGADAARLGSGTVRDYPPSSDHLSWMIGYITALHRDEEAARKLRGATAPLPLVGAA